MSRVSRADWAAQVPASGIIGVLPAAHLPPTPSGAVDIGSLKAAGFIPGSIPLWNGSQFVPAPLPLVPAVTGLTLTSQYPFISWVPSTLRSIESTEVAVALPGATMGSLVFVASVPGQDYLWFQARMTSLGLATITTTNMSGDVIALVDGTYQVFVLT
jgi:hypothetical protein